MTHQQINKPHNKCITLDFLQPKMLNHELLLTIAESSRDRSVYMSTRVQIMNFDHSVCMKVCKVVKITAQILSFTSRVTQPITAIQSRLYRVATINEARLQMSNASVQEQQLLELQTARQKLTMASSN